MRPIDPNHVSLGYDVYRKNWNPWTEMSCRLTHKGACNLQFRNSQTKVVELANHSVQKSCWWNNQSVKRKTCCWNQARENYTGKHTFVGFYYWLAENIARGSTVSRTDITIEKKQHSHNIQPSVEWIFWSSEELLPALRVIRVFSKVQSNKPMSGAVFPSCRPGSVQLNLYKNMKRQTDPYGRAMKR